MYKIYMDGETLHHPNRSEDGYIVLSPVLSTELNCHGSLEFTMLPGHPHYDKVKKLTSMITVMDDEGEIFRGRVLNETTDFYNRKKVYAEGDMSFLLDSIVRPFNYVGTLQGFLKKLIDNHNSQTEAGKHFSVGEITVSPSGGTITRYSEKPMTTWECVRDMLVGQLGGFLRIRLDNGQRLLDYLYDYPNYNSQVIRFGKNLLDIEKYITAENIITCIIPYGKEIGEGQEGHQPQPEGTAEYDGSRVTIRSVNGGVDYLRNEEAVAVFGEIWGTNIWNDIESPAELKAAAETWLNANVAENLSITVKALDLHLVDVDASKIKLGDHIRVYSAPHNIDIWMQVSSIQNNLLNPDQTEITLGYERATLTGSISGGKSVGAKLTAAQVEILQSVRMNFANIDSLNAANAKITNLDAENGNIKKLVSEEIQTRELLAETVQSNYGEFGSLTADTATLIKLLAGEITAEEVETELLNANEVKAANAKIKNLFADNITAESGSFHYLAADKLSATYATIATLESDYATIKLLEARDAVIENLSANYGEINTLLSNFAAIGKEQVFHLSGGNVVFDDATFGSALIASLSAAKASVGTLYTSLVKIASDADERLTLDGSTIKIKDSSNVLRVQIGKDGDGDYSLYLWDSAGNLLWQPTGITGKGIGNGTIKNDNVASDAAIDGSKLNIQSVAQKLNDDGSLVVDSANVVIDDKRLDAAYKTLSESVSGLGTKTESLETSLSTVQGNISSKIWQTDINAAKDALGKDIKSITDQYAALNQTMSGFETRVGKFESMEIGGRNMLPNSSFALNTSGWRKSTNNNIEFVTEDGIECARITGKLGSTKELFCSFAPSVKDGDDSEQIYTLSADVKLVDYAAGSTNPAVTLYVCGVHTVDGLEEYFDSEYIASSAGNIGDTSIVPLNNKGWSRMWITVSLPYDTTAAWVDVLVRDCTGTLFIRNLKFERGGNATDWTPAPEDAEQRISVAESSIIQSATDISLRVEKKDYTGEIVASLINQSADTVKISAGHIELDGVATFINTSYIEPVNAVAKSAASTASAAKNTAEAASSSAASAQQTANGAMQKSDYTIEKSGRTMIDGGIIDTEALFAQDIVARNSFQVDNDTFKLIQDASGFSLQTTESVVTEEPSTEPVGLLRFNNSGNLTIRSFGTSGKGLVAGQISLDPTDINLSANGAWIDIGSLDGSVQIHPSDGSYMIYLQGNANISGDATIEGNCYSSARYAAESSLPATSSACDYSHDFAVRNSSGISIGNLTIPNWTHGRMIHMNGSSDAAFIGVGYNKDMYVAYRNSGTWTGARKFPNWGSVNSYANAVTTAAGAWGYQAIATIPAAGTYLFTYQLSTEGGCGNSTIMLSTSPSSETIYGTRVSCNDNGGFWNGTMGTFFGSFAKGDVIYARYWTATAGAAAIYGRWICLQE